MGDEQRKPGQDAGGQRGAEADTFAEELRGAVQLFIDHAELRHKRDRRDRMWTSFRRAFLVAIVGTMIIGYGAFFWDLSRDRTTPLPKEPTVAVVPVQGEIKAGGQASADQVVPLIERACKASMVKSVVLRINSPGGAPTEALRMATAVDQCRQGEHPKKVYAVIESLGASAAYMVAIHTDKIIADRYALVGSVGAIMQYFDASEAVNKLGVIQKIYRSGPLKGGPSMFAPTSPEDALLNKDLVTELGQTFLDDVVKQRGKRLKMTPAELFTGRVWTASNGLRYGLIDEVGVLEDLKDTLFKDLKVVTFKSSRGPAKMFGLEDMLQRVTSKALAEVMQPKVE